jgi:hypothetical protein
MTNQTQMAQSEHNRFAPFVFFGFIERTSYLKITHVIYLPLKTLFFTKKL